VVLSESQLKQIIGKMNATVPGSTTTLLYSGQFGNNKAWKIAEAIGKNKGSLYGIC